MIDKTSRDTGMSPGPGRKAGRLVRLQYALVVLALLILVLFVALAEDAHERLYFPIDLVVSRAVQSFRPAWFDFTMRALTVPGQSLWAVVSVIVVVAIIWFAGAHREALFLLAATAIAEALDIGVKLIVARPRPDEFLIRVAQALHDPSFPSGHVVQYTVFYGFLFVLVYIHMKHSFRRTLLLGVLMFLIVGVGVSRVYLGEHWPSDVVGGYLLGSVWLGVCVWAYRLTRRKKADLNSEPLL